MIDVKTLEILNNQDWEKIIYHLTLYVKYRVGISKKDDSSDKLLKGLQPDDFALNAINLIYSGEREWDCAKDPDLLKFLKYSVINSLLYSYFKSKEVKTTVRLDAFNENEDEADAVDPLYNIKDSNALADSELIAKQYLENIRSIVKDDPEESLVLEELIIGSKPAEIAGVLEIPIEDIRNILKRIRRKLSNNNRS